MSLENWINKANKREKTPGFKIEIHNALNKNIKYMKKSIFCYLKFQITIPSFKSIGQF